MRNGHVMYVLNKMYASVNSCNGSQNENAMKSVTYCFWINGSNSVIHIKYLPLDDNVDTPQYDDVVVDDDSHNDDADGGDDDDLWW